ncbi:MAG: hypothetical protein H7336_05810 [Bacteriovorax sp.]|nr:hypothetical protein [Bacteriovorax sp.]
MKRLVILTALAFSTSLFANDAKWICLKDGKVTEAKADKVEQKKTACEALKGTWTEAKSEEKPKQEAGKSAGW